MQNILQHIPKTDKLLQAIYAQNSDLNYPLVKSLVADFLISYKERLLSGGARLEIESCAKEVIKSYQNLTQNL